MKAAMQEYCWRKRIKPSPYLAGLIREIIESPEKFEGASIPPAGLDYASVYVNDETWTQGMEVAEVYDVKLSAMVRVGIARDLTAEDIPWSVTTARPRNDSIPIRE